MPSDTPQKLTVTVIGFENVGKSFFCEKLINRSGGNLGTKLYGATIGASFFPVRIDEPGIGSCEIQLWDTAGSDKYSTLLPLYLRNAQVGLIFYDFSSEESFDKLEEYYKMINDVNEMRQLQGHEENEKKLKGKIQCILIGVDNPYKNGHLNPAQLSQVSKVTYELGIEFAQSHDSTFITLDYSTWDNLSLIKQNLINIAQGKALEGGLLFHHIGTVDQHLDVDNEDMIHSNDKGNDRNKKKCTIM